MKDPGKSVKKVDSKPVVQDGPAMPPAGDRSRVVGIAQRSGPLPDADELQAYREHSPEAYDAILREFQANGEHRREMERRSMALDEVVVPGLLKLDDRGLKFSFGLGVLAIGAVTVAAVLGGTSAAISTAVPGVLMSLPGLIRAMRGRHGPSDDRKGDSP